MRYLLIALLLLPACQSANPFRRDLTEAEMFGPASLRIHPVFTQVKDWTGDARDDGIEALLEFQDRFGDPTKAQGTAVFELYELAMYAPDHRGQRVVNPFVGALVSVANQQEHWNSTSRTYAFRLAYPQVDARRSYVLAVSFQLAGGGRLFAQTVIPARGQENTLDEPATQPGRRAFEP